MLNLQIVEAESPLYTRQVVALLRDYKLWMGRRYVDELAIIDEHFDESEWQSELADLKGHYGAPHGAILIALVDGAAAGCVVMRGIGEDVAELKRLFVRPAFQELGIARSLVPRIAELAIARGYTMLRLETGSRQTEALALYLSLGFRRIAPYHETAGVRAPNMLSFEARARDLVARRAPPRNLCTAA